jgi:UDP-N-acetylmuramoylalanine--D-glutamate ligase
MKAEREYIESARDRLRRAESLIAMAIKDVNSVVTINADAGKADLSAILRHLGHVAGAYLIGEAAPMFAEQLQGLVPVTHSDTLAQAMADVLVAAKPGDVVLFSPAAASFDQYRDFEDRGAAFRAAVAAL